MLKELYPQIESEKGFEENEQEEEEEEEPKSKSLKSGEEKDGENEKAGEGEKQERKQVSLLQVVDTGCNGNFFVRLFACVDPIKFVETLLECAKHKRQSADLFVPKVPSLL